MDKASYPLYSPFANFYTFTSIGKNGFVQKAVVFQEVENGIFNLALVDYEPTTQLWSDMTNTNNGDLPKIMATVVHIIKHFLEENPSRIIYMEGNTKSKNMLYNRIVNNYYDQFSETFDIMVNGEDGKEEFKLGKQYDSFYIYLKIR